MQIHPDKIKNILVVRNDRFGEFLLNIPALRALRETFLKAKIIVVVNPYTRELVQHIPFVDEVIVWDREARRALTEKIKFIGLIRRKNIDIAIMLNPSKEFNFFSYLAGIPVRVGYNRKWGFLLNRKIEDRKYLRERHEVEYNLELVNLIGAETNDLSLSLNVDENAANNLFREFKIGDDDNIIAIHPWTSDMVKQWPKEYFRRLAKRLIEELDLKVIIIGGRDESLRDKELFNDIATPGLINLAGKTNLLQLAAVLKRVKLLISGDSGPVHLAGCVGTPVVAIFRNNIPGKTPVRWGPVSKGSVVIERERLPDISIEEVFLATRKVLGK